MKLRRSSEHLTAVRGLAALVVLVSHIVQVFWIRIIGLGSPLQLLASESSRLAVLAFFVLSGFVIAASIESNIAKNRRFSFRSYFASRFARIYPPFLLAVVISVGVVLVLQAFQLPGSNGLLGFPGDVYRARDYVAAPEAEVIRALLMVSGLGGPNGALWSLFIEAKVYFVFAALVLAFVSRRFLAGAFVLAVALIPGLLYNDQFCRYAAIWLVGCVLYYATTEQTPKGRGLISAVAMALFLIADLIGGWVAGKSFVEHAISLVFETGSALAIGLTVFLLPIHSRILERVGEFSYSLYAFHLPILLLIQSLVVAFAGPSLPVTIAASIAAAAAAFGAAAVGGIIEQRRDAVRTAVAHLMDLRASRSPALLRGPDQL